ncbi:transmembrane protein 69-like [Thalassophryne amazonica]|uniref:transmembrane protein 69-like n=1 Tax=Thalassophryne amazonica TaxID=390379 RepID=UPI001471BD41|nr:transmembrane protein 69-like [Thalassophryne amazonica]XP_034038619.1 transmembrane protein 69-like [Thalassophryne amazonica]
MISFTSGRHIISGVPLWRRFQGLICRNYSTKAQLLFYSQSPALLSLPQSSSTYRLSSIRPSIWPASRLCHTGLQGTSDGQGNRRPKEGLSLRALIHAPKPALYVGFSGLLPFVSAPLVMAVTQSFYPEVAYAQVMYGACIVAFLGGCRWGFAIPDSSPAQPDWKNLGNSVVLSLLAWLALLCRESVSEGALLVLMGLGLSLHYDLTLLPGYPSWFKAMRTILTLVATFSIVATLALMKVCPERKMTEAQK